METEEALRRVRLIVPMLRQDVSTAVTSHAVMEAANDTIPRGLTGHHTEFVDTYHAVQNALALKLTMDIARIFDLSDTRRFPAERQDKASIPVLAALMGRPDVQEALEHDAARWLAGVESIGAEDDAAFDDVITQLEADQRAEDSRDCKNAIAGFLAATSTIGLDGSEEREALSRIRQVRDRRLAHSLFDKEPDNLPRYSDLYLLLGLAKNAAKHAALAVEGINTRFDNQAIDDRKNADGYSACVLDGLKRASDPRSRPQDHAEYP